MNLLSLFILLMLTSCATINANPTSSPQVEILNLNVFDQQQGVWSEGLRESRLRALSEEIKKSYYSLDIIVMQESQGRGGNDGKFHSTDYRYFKSLFPYAYYTHESRGKDGMSYGYLILSKRKPKKVWHHRFSFKGGSKRVMQFSLWEVTNFGCLGVTNLHLSWQGSEVRKKEAQLILDNLKHLKEKCPKWLFVGDFNADQSSPEMNLLFNNGLKDLFSNRKPTVGPFNPIRSIYGKIKNQTIDWALAINLEGSAEVLFDKPVGREIWVSDHAAILIKIP